MKWLTIHTARYFLLVHLLRFSKGIKFSSAGSPAAILSAETLSADNANLLSTTDPEPLTEMDSMATDRNTFSGSTANPAFAPHQSTVARLLVSAFYPDWSPLPSLLKILT